MSNEVARKKIADALATGAKALDLSGLGLKSVPEEIVQLQSLTELYLYENQLTAVPAELGQLRRLTILRLDRNKLTLVSAELRRLQCLTELYLYNNQLISVPAVLGQLQSLTELHLDNNQLTSVPAEFGQLKSLNYLFLSGNQLTSVPPELGQLQSLIQLWVQRNQLKLLPPELGQLQSLTALQLHANHLTSLPVELGQLQNLTDLQLYKNPLTFPPPEIVSQGTRAILEFLSAELKKPSLPHAHDRIWKSKLLLVGEGGVGKTQLLRRLRGKPFIEKHDPTHGLSVKEVTIGHPTLSEVTMTLNGWDFGGQEIYHATHQFFFSNRSLFLLLWNSRLGWVQGRLYYWLDTIRARAPESTVILVATHIDEHRSQLPLADLQRRYPQILDAHEVSNKDGTGIDNLLERLRRVAADPQHLPLMGERRPPEWLGASQALKDNDSKWITRNEVHKLLRKHGVSKKGCPVLSRQLHELGEIVHFDDEPELRNLAVTDPHWLTHSIATVLDCEKIGDDGLVTRKTLWPGIDGKVRSHLIRLMDRFDLSYETAQNSNQYLVVEKLSVDAPDFRDVWDSVLDLPPCREVSMKFDLQTTIPAGIPTWFIAREHRFSFSPRVHWRYGMLLQDREEQHLGLIQSFPHERYVQLTIRGPMPHSFFALLKDGLELTFSRFPGLQIRRTVPCPCPQPDEPQCDVNHEFEFADVDRRFQFAKPNIECGKGMRDIPISQLLFGLDLTGTNESLEALEAKIDQILKELQGARDDNRELRELAQREFLKLCQLVLKRTELECPHVFVIRPKNQNAWSKMLTGQKMELQLYCQHPGEWHPTEHGGCYEIAKPAEWLTKLAPHVRAIVRILKYVKPLVWPVLDKYAEEAAKLVKKDIKLMESLIDKLPEIESKRNSLEFDDIPKRAGREALTDAVSGAALRCAACTSSCNARTRQNTTADCNPC